MNPKMLASFVDGTKTMVEMAAVANATGFSPATGCGPEETDPNRLGEVFSLADEERPPPGYYHRGLRARGGPGVFVVVRSEEGPVRETLRYLGRGAGPNHVFYRPYHLEPGAPISVAPAAVCGEPTIVPLPAPTAEVVPCQARPEGRREARRDGSADYLQTCTGSRKPPACCRSRLASGPAPPARARGEVMARSGVELAEGSFVVALRRLQDTAAIEG